MLAYLIDDQQKQQYRPRQSMRRETAPANQEVGVLKLYKLKRTTSVMPLLIQAVVKQNTPPMYIKYEEFRKKYPYLLISYLETKYNIVSRDQNAAGNQVVTRSRADNSARQRENILKQLRSQSKESKMIDEKQLQPQVKQSQQEESLSVSYQSSTEVNIEGIMTSQRSMRKVPDIPKYEKRHYSPPKPKKRMLLDPEIVKQQEQKQKAAKKLAKKQEVVIGPKVLDYQQIMKERFGQDYAIYFDWCLFTKEKDIFRATKQVKYHPPKKSANRPKPTKKEKPQSGNSQWQMQEPRTESNRARRYAKRQ